MAWKSVPGYEGLYEASDRGQVRSVDREVPNSRGGGTRLHRGKILAPSASGTSGHLKVSLCQGGVAKAHLIHHLVLEAFDQPCPAGLECLHGTGGPADNRWPENIRWGTSSENNGVDKHRDGTMYQVKLTPEIVLVCRARRSQGDTWVAMGRDYGVHANTVSAAVAGRTWAHLAAA